MFITILIVLHGKNISPTNDGHEIERTLNIAFSWFVLIMKDFVVIVVILNIISKYLANVYSL